MRFLWLLAFVLAIPEAGADQVRKPSSAIWNPGRTWVFAVGVLEFADESYGSFPQTNRRDEELLSVLRGRGVPESQIVSLKDRQATLAGIKASLDKLLKKTRPGDLLWIYYAGHGAKTEDGRGFFIPYDSKDSLDKTAWSVESIFAAVEKGFRGSHVFLTADCCYSGALGVAAMKRGRKKSYACLTSSNSSTISTGGWTFTEALIDGFSGRFATDKNGDGKVELAELGSYVEDEMVLFEEQLSSFGATGAFPANLVLSSAESPPKNSRVGERLEAKWGEEWWKARILEVGADQVKVRYIGDYDRTENWLEESDLRPLSKPQELSVGDRVEVEFTSKWYPARVLGSKRGIYHIHYDGFSSTWDEWAGSKRIRIPQAGEAP